MGSLQEGDDVVRPFDRAERASVPLDVAREVLGGELRLVRVEHAVEVLAREREVRFGCGIGGAQIGFSSHCIGRRRAGREANE